MNHQILRMLVLTATARRLRVRALREAVQNGTYQLVSAEVLAQKIIEDVESRS
jgi:anti-sigma28 factor (negative regulator of flagellin synthesis)